jgi:hypothetical protein
MESSPVNNNGKSMHSNGQSPRLSSKSETLKALMPLVKACVDSPEDEGLDLVATCLADIPLDALKVAIARFLTESEDRWFPAVGKLRRLAVESQAGIIPDWEWAWSEILKALRVWNQFDKEACLKARGMLGEELMGLVGSMGGFYTLANSDNLEVIRSNFRNSWTEKRKQTETLRKTPEAIRPRVGLPSEVSANLESFGTLDQGLLK